MDNGASSYRRYLSGDESAFADIVKEYWSSLVFFLDRIVLDPSAAEDIAMDVLSDLIAYRHRYDFRVSLKTYLFMVGRSRALNYIKRRRTIPMVSLTEAEAAASAEDDPAELFLADQRNRAIHKALSQLEPQQRMAIHLVYFEDMTCEEAASVMKKSRKQVYNLLYRAKEKLRTILGEEGAQYL
jgi:RNA polymerase sigma-70 factor (ECF subfamily)